MKHLALIGLLALAGGCSFLSPKMEIKVVEIPTPLECPAPDRFPQRPVLTLLPDGVDEQAVVRITAQSLEALESYATQTENLLYIYRDGVLKANEEGKKKEKAARADAAKQVEEQKMK